MQKRHYIIFFLVLMMLFQMVNTDNITFAQGQIKLTAGLGTYPIRPGEPFDIVYNITNSTDRAISVNIYQELYSSDNRPVPGSSITISSSELIQPRKHQSISSAGDYDAIDGYVKYSVEYAEEGQNEWKKLGEGTINIVNMDLSVSYKVNAPGKVKKNDEVQYTAVVESDSNVAISDIIVIDSQMGELGRISRLEPGDGKTLTKYFRPQATTESYLILRYKDPMGVRGEITQEFPNAKVKVQVQEQEPVYSLELSGSVDKSFITSEEEVTIKLRIKNSGNVALNNVQCTDWNGNVFFEIVSLAPGQETTAEYKARVSPDKEYKIICSGTPEDGAEKVNAAYNIMIKKAEANIDIKREFEPQEIAPGDTVTLNYTIINSGNVTLVNGVVEEPELGNVSSFDKLEPGEEKTFSVQAEMDEDGIISKTVVTAKDPDTGETYRFEADELLIPVAGGGQNAHLSIDVTFDPPSLEEAGAVEVICTVINDGDIELNNIEVFIKERDIPMGSVLTLSPGQEETFRLPQLGVEETESFTIVVKAEDQEGNDYEFTSEPFEIVVGLEGLDDEEDAGSRGRVAVLRTILIVIILLIILTAGALLYVLRDSIPFFQKFRKRRTLKNKAPSSRS